MGQAQSPDFEVLIHDAQQHLQVQSQHQSEHDDGRKGDQARGVDEGKDQIPKPVGRALCRAQSPKAPDDAQRDPDANAAIGNPNQPTIGTLSRLGQRETSLLGIEDRQSGLQLRGRDIDGSVDRIVHSYHPERYVSAKRAGLGGQLMVGSRKRPVDPVRRPAFERLSARPSMILCTNRSCRLFEHDGIEAGYDDQGQ